MSAPLKAIHTHGWDFWLARASVLAIVGLQLLMINDLAVGARWLAPVIAIALLLPLSVATALTFGECPRDQVLQAGTRAAISFATPHGPLARAESSDGTRASWKRRQHGEVGGHRSLPGVEFVRLATV